MLIFTERGYNTLGLMFQQAYNWHYDPETMQRTIIPFEIWNWVIRNELQCLLNRMRYHSQDMLPTNPDQTAIWNIEPTLSVQVDWKLQFNISPPRFSPLAPLEAVGILDVLDDMQLKHQGYMPIYSRRYIVRHVCRLARCRLMCARKVLQFCCPTRWWK